MLVKALGASCAAVLLCVVVVTSVVTTVVATLLGELDHRQGRYGLETMRIGGGQGLLPSSSDCLE